MLGGRHPLSKVPQARSNRSRFITLSQARTNSCNETLLRVVGGVDLREGPELRVGPEDKIHTGAGPLHFVRGTISSLEYVFALIGCLPHGSHVEEVHEEIGGEGLGSVGEYAMAGLPDVRTQGPQATDEHRHLRCREGQ